MGVSALGAIPIGIGVSAFIASILVAFLLINAPQEKLARTLAYSLTGFAVWGWFSFAYFLTNDPDTARTLRLLSLAGQIPGQIFSIRYFYVYLEQYRPIKPFENFVQWLLMFGNIALLITPFLDILLRTKLIFGSVLVDANGMLALAPQPALIAPLHAAAFLIVPFIGVWIMLPRILHERGSARRVGIIILTAFIGAYVAGGTGYLTWYEIETPLVMLRGIGIPLFVVLAAYTISNYQLFNVRVAAAEIFVFLMWGFVFWRALLNPSFAEAAPDIILFVASIIVGLLFIRSITHELSIRIKLEDVSARLHVLNTSLESEVEKRTHELMQAKKHTDDVVEHLPVGLIEILEDTTVVRCNEVAAQIIDAQAGKIIKTKALSNPVLLSILGEEIKTGSREVQITQNNRQRDLSISITPLILETGSGHIIIIRDVTERRALERAKNDFVATAAHQLRTPLSAIKWTFELLSTESLTKAQKEVLDRGSAGVKNMMNIAEGLLMSIRTSEGISEFKFADTNFGEVLDSAIKIVSPLADKKGVNVKIDVPETLPIMHIEKDRLVSATQNLLDNAVRYTPKGGSIYLSVTVSEDMLTLSIKDTGIGISEEDQQHLFERFFRAKDAVETATDGSGLGLSIAKSVIEAHGGTLSVESEKGSGSVFSYRVPIRQKNK